MEGMELELFNLISYAGDAKSSFILSISMAKQGEYKKAREIFEQGKKSYLEAHKVHANLVHKEASDDKLPISLLLIHTQDQLSSAESFKILSEEFIDLYEEMDRRIKNK